MFVSKVVESWMAIEMYDPSSDPNSYKIIVWWSSAKVPKASNSIMQLETSMSTDFYVLPCRAQVQNFTSWSWCHFPAQVLFYHISLRASHQLIWARPKQWSTWCNCVNWCLQLQKRGNTPVRLGSWITTNCTHCRFAKVCYKTSLAVIFFLRGKTLQPQTWPTDYTGRTTSTGGTKTSCLQGVPHCQSHGLRCPSHAAKPRGWGFGGFGHSGGGGDGYALWLATELVSWCWSQDELGAALDNSWQLDVNSAMRNKSDKSICSSSRS